MDESEVERGNSRRGEKENCSLHVIYEKRINWKNNKKQHKTHKHKIRSKNI